MVNWLEIMEKPPLEEEEETENMNNRGREI